MNFEFCQVRQTSWRPSWILKKPSQWQVATQPNSHLDIIIYPKTQKNDCKGTLQGSHGIWGCATGLLHQIGHFVLLHATKLMLIGDQQDAL